MKKYIKPSIESFACEMKFNFLSGPGTDATSNMVGKSQLSKDVFSWDDEDADN